MLQALILLSTRACYELEVAMGSLRAHSTVTLSTRQKLVIAAYASISSAREAALVLGVSEQELLEELHLIRAALRAAGYAATASRPALLKAARETHQLPSSVGHEA